MASIDRQTEFNSFVIKSMATLVADASTDATVVPGMIEIQIEERWLQNRSLENDLVYCAL